MRCDITSELCIKCLRWQICAEISEKMASTEVSVKGNGVNGKTEGFPSGYNNHEEARNVTESQNAHTLTAKGN